MTQQYVDTRAYERLADEASAAVAGLADTQLRWKPAPGKWSILEILSHLEDHTLAQAFRIRKLISEPGAELPSVNQDAWVECLKANQGQVADILSTIRAVLYSNAVVLRRVDAADWQKTGIHPNGNPVTLTDVVQGFVNHVHHHLQQIRELASKAP
ncbi:hypothetical protein GCM10025857_26150 [Alicyclobacillus contaminans]|uniref:DinB family protein n=1 Tax=Alicyclobacillus contaminans TaxID=392016 RepID=UPI0003FD83B7|nr:DinB family protein [Alicyclobacillus contaminans]GMA51258.1 hypothetical protein GCM10025857_26150 [Alicyclobacillus contaminans]